MKKAALVILAIVIVGGGLYGFFFVKYTHEEGIFAEWHKSLATAQEEAAQRNVPLLVKVGSPL